MNTSSFPKEDIRAQLEQLGKDVWMDGEFVPREDAKTHIMLNTALHYGLAVFEGLRFYQNSKGGRSIMFLREHIKRLFKSAEGMHALMRYTPKEVMAATIEVVKRSDIGEGYLRPIVYYAGRLDPIPPPENARIAIGAWKWGKYYEQPIRLGVSSYTRIDPNSIPIEVKFSACYINSFLARKEVQEKGYDDALLLDKYGKVAEASGANIFIVKKGKLITPQLGAILPGITRAAVITMARHMKIPCTEGRVTLQQVYKADECMLTGTAYELTEVIQVGGATIGPKGKHSIYDKLAPAYKAIAYGEDLNPKYASWLTPVD